MTGDEVLAGAVVDQALAQRGSGWQRLDDQLVKRVRWADFSEALAFVNAVGSLAESADHHPDIDIRWNRVTLSLTTHSAGGLTGKDLALAAEIDALGGAAD